MESIHFLIPALVAAAIGLAAGYAATRMLDKSRIQSAKSYADSIIQAANKEAETTKREALLQAKDKLFQARTELETEIKERRTELSARESRLLKKEENLERKSSQIETRETALSKREREAESGYKKLKDKERDIEDLINKQYHHPHRLGLPLEIPSSVLLPDTTWPQAGRNGSRTFAYVRGTGAPPPATAEPVFFYSYPNPGRRRRRSHVPVYILGSGHQCARRHLHHDRVPGVLVG